MSKNDGQFHIWYDTAGDFRKQIDALRKKYHGMSITAVIKMAVANEYARVGGGDVHNQG